MRLSNINGKIVLQFLSVIVLTCTYGIECAAQGSKFEETSVATEEKKSSAASRSDSNSKTSTKTPAHSDGKTQAPSAAPAVVVDVGESSEDKADRSSDLLKRNARTVITITVIALGIIVPCAAFSAMGGSIALWQKKKRIGVILLITSFLFVILAIASPGLANWSLVSLQEAGIVPWPPEIITLEDLSGMSYECELQEIIDFEDKEFALLRKISQPSNTKVVTEDGALVILQIVQKDGASVFRPLKDDQEFERVSKEFDRRNH
jgi:hypothetical protein